MLDRDTLLAEAVKCLNGDCDQLVIVGTTADPE